MRYCVDYSKKSTVLKKADEIRIYYSEHRNIYNVLDFIRTHPEQDVIVSLYYLTLDKIKKGNIIEELFRAADENPDLNIKFEIPVYDEDIIKIINKNIDIFSSVITKEVPVIREEIKLGFEEIQLEGTEERPQEVEVTEEIEPPKIKWFIGERINNWDTLVGFIKLGVSDVIVCEEICFELDKVAAIAHSAGVNVRVYANVAQSEFKNTPALYKFFIRPEDVPEYEPYVDVIEFYGENTSKKDVYYKVYAEDHKWFGKLNEVIIDFDSDLDSRFIIPRFAERRIRCNKSCLKGGNCHICNRIEDLSKTLEKAKIIVTMDKKEKEEVNIDGEGNREQEPNNAEDVGSISE